MSHPSSVSKRPHHPHDTVHSPGGLVCGSDMPVHPLLVRHGVCCKPVPSVQQVQHALVALEPLKTALKELSLLRLIAEYAVAPTGQVISVGVVSDRCTMRLMEVRCNADMTVELFARACKSRGITASLTLDNFLVHVTTATVPFSARLLHMGTRANSCIAPVDGTRKGWGVFQEWKGGPLTDDELEWLNSRTLAEAGVVHGDVIDSRYAMHIDDMFKGVVKPVPAGAYDWTVDFT